MFAASGFTADRLSFEISQSQMQSNCHNLKFMCKNKIEIFQHCVICIVCYVIFGSVFQSSWNAVWTMILILKSQV